LLEGLLLAAVGGFMDAFTFVRFGVFANIQTGNIVLIGVRVSNAHWEAAALHLVPVVAFIAGVVGVDLLGRPKIYSKVRRPVRIALGVEIVGLAVVAGLPDSTPGPVITIIVSVVAAIQFTSFRTLVDTPYTTLAASGNLRTMATAIHHRLLDHDKDAGRQASRLAEVVIVFTVAAAVGALVTKHAGNTAAAAGAAMLLITLTIFITETVRLERAAAEEAAQRPAEEPSDG
jgi:uncharacterized membrane protein YoaK (UPF0700 family)